MSWHSMPKLCTRPGWSQSERPCPYGPDHHRPDSEPVTVNGPTSGTLTITTTGFRGDRPGRDRVPPTSPIPGRRRGPGHTMTITETIRMINTDRLAYRLVMDEPRFLDEPIVYEFPMRRRDTAPPRPGIRVPRRKPIDADNAPGSTAQRGRSNRSLQAREQPAPAERPSRYGRTGPAVPNGEAMEVKGKARTSTRTDKSMKKTTEQFRLPNGRWHDRARTNWTAWYVGGCNISLKTSLVELRTSEEPPECPECLEERKRKAQTAPPPPQAPTRASTPPPTKAPAVETAKKRRKPAPKPQKPAPKPQKDQESGRLF